MSLAGATGDRGASLVFDIFTKPFELG